MKNTEIKEQKEQRETIEEIANNISSLAKSVRSLINGPLNKKALIILLAHSSGQYQNTVEKVLTALEDLDKDWLSK